MSSLAQQSFRICSATLAHFGEGDDRGTVGRRQQVAHLVADGGRDRVQILPACLRHEHEALDVADRLAFEWKVVRTEFKGLDEFVGRLKVIGQARRNRSKRQALASCHRCLLHPQPVEGFLDRRDVHERILA